MSPASGKRRRGSSVCADETFRNQTRVIGSTGTPGAIVEVMVALVM